MILSALRYFWIASKGHRFRPWESPYVQWRLETFFGKEAEAVDGPKFFRLLWRERARLIRFLRWVEERRAEEK